MRESGWVMEILRGRGIFGVGFAFAGFGDSDALLQIMLNLPMWPCFGRCWSVQCAEQ
jgi:hypothetical protein